MAEAYVLMQKLASIVSKDAVDQLGVNMEKKSDSAENSTAVGQVCVPTAGLAVSVRSWGVEEVPYACMAE